MFPFETYRYPHASFYACTHLYSSEFTCKYDILVSPCENVAPVLPVVWGSPFVENDSRLRILARYRMFPFSRSFPFSIYGHTPWDYQSMFAGEEPAFHFKGRLAINLGGTDYQYVVQLGCYVGTPGFHVHAGVVCLCMHNSCLYNRFRSFKRACLPLR